MPEIPALDRHHPGGK